MIQTFVAFTEEIDDVESAVAEVLSQFDVTALKRNTVGILACHYEFIHSGVVKALCDALPFPVTGTITTAQAVEGKSSILALTLTVMTSDDIVFQPVLSQPLTGGGDNAKAMIAAAYTDAVAAQGQRPAIAFVYAPFMIENSGDDYVAILSEVSGNVPFFGTVAVDDTLDFRDCFTIYEGVHYHDRMALVLFYGDLHPKFRIATISSDKIFPNKALITSSDGHILKGVNDRPVSEFFKNLGLVQASETGYAMSSLPFMLDYNDGSPPVSRVFVNLNEKQEAVCAGAMPVGATLQLGAFDKEDVLLTSRAALKEALDQVDNTASFILIYSCVARNMSLGGDILAELDAIKEDIGTKIPFMMAYSGGEICPTEAENAVATNRFHNNSFVLCLL